MTDAFGEELKVGDYVGYITGGRYQDTFKGRVVKLGKTRFQIEVTKYHGTSPLKRVGETLWCEPHRATKTLEDFSDPCNCDKEIR